MLCHFTCYVFEITVNIKDMPGTYCNGHALCEIIGLFTQFSLKGFKFLALHIYGSRKAVIIQFNIVLGLFI